MARRLQDFAAVIGGFKARAHDGLYSAEYIDLPGLSLPLADPAGWSVDLMNRVRPLVTS